MFLCIKDLKDSTTKLLDLINTLSKIEEYKINTQKLTVVLYSNNKHMEKEVRESNSFTTASKILKILP